MMNEVIQKHLAIGQKTGTLEYRLALNAQFPVLLPCLVRNVLERLTNLSTALVEHTHELLRGFQIQRLEVALGKIQAGHRQDCYAKSGQLGDVGSEVG